MTTHRTGKASGKLRLFLILTVIFLTAGIVGWIWYQQEPNTKLVSELYPAKMVTPSPSPTNRPVRLVAEIPKQLTDEQLFGLWVVEQVLEDPQKWVGKSKVRMSENDRQVFVALILTESSFLQFAEDGATLDSGIDCDGLAQLCNNPAVCNPNLRWNPFENAYCGAAYFKNLVEKWDGNYAKAIAEYKGAIKTLPNGRTIPNPDHPAVGMLFDFISVR